MFSSHFIINNFSVVKHHLQGPFITSTHETQQLCLHKAGLSYIQLYVLYTVIFSSRINEFLVPDKCCSSTVLKSACHHGQALLLGGNFWPKHLGSVLEALTTTPQLSVLVSAPFLPQHPPIQKEGPGTQTRQQGWFRQPFLFSHTFSTGS